MAKRLIKPLNEIMGCKQWNSLSQNRCFFNIRECYAFSYICEIINCNYVRGLSLKLDAGDLTNGRV